ncbi:MAG: ferredoxin [Deltaproteobacteria bacterium CG_4_10_14_3_um_filter_60_8]|nr:MAG: ferredoxin [Deltaproteobacteria bacterium CG23_combo_of_CG06-09_8_20_14_all_60_8]PIY25553.1 MAG: ferredoxin [Deltaproteobacteria bacterium CG_4_10_14_3_um_filter_60_8]
MKMPVVDEELCIGCEVCADLCPEVFEIQDEKSKVIGPGKCPSCDCQEAVDSCPVGAITLVEENS